MRVVLTGPTGQVGSALKGFLKGEIFPLPREEFDLANPRPEAIRSFRPDVIVNAAAYTAVDRAEDEPGLAHAVNAVAPGVLAEEAKRTGALLVHFSTDYVFDGMKSSAYVEDDPVNPLNVYGKTKLTGEEAIRASGCRHLILRTSWVYAAAGRNFMKAILSKAEKGEPLRVVDDQTGAPTWAGAIAAATAEILKKEASGTYHLSAAGQTTWHGFAREILRLRKIDVPLQATRTEDFPTRARRPRYSVLSNERLRRELGVSMPSWEAQLARCLEIGDSYRLA